VVNYGSGGAAEILAFVFKDLEWATIGDMQTAEKHPIASITLPTKQPSAGPDYYLVAAGCQLAAHGCRRSVDQHRRCPPGKPGDQSSAYGGSFSLALIIESPIIMRWPPRPPSAKIGHRTEAVPLHDGRQAILTALHVLVAFTPYDLVVRQIMGAGGDNRPARRLVIMTPDLVNRLPALQPGC
jgi:hypothetical protein